MTLKIALIGGTGLQSMSSGNLIAQHRVETEYGTPSSEINEIELDGRQFLFLARHGLNQQIPPHRINYRANIDALKQLGTTAIFSVTAVGGVQESLKTGDLVIPDQLVDYTWGRESTFYDGLLKARRHIDFTYPYSAEIRASLLSAKDCILRTVCDGGIYGCAQGPRLETAAEIIKMRADGIDIVGMTGMPEAALARELDMDYACLSVVVNPAAGMSGSVLSEEEIEEECHKASKDIVILLESAMAQFTLMSDSSSVSSV